jgi:site-specific recombinase XerD
MFESLFKYPGVLRRHREGPLAAERATYLSGLETIGMARRTILRRASYCLCVAVEIQRWPADRHFDEAEVDALAQAWAAARVTSGRASSSRWPKEHFRFAATDLLQSLGRLHPAPRPAPGQYELELTEFIAAQREGPWLSEKTCQAARWQITRFIDYLEQRGVAMSDLTPIDVDAFFEHMASRWSRNSLRTSGKMLRAWFRYCETRSWVSSGLAEAILLPRIYRHEGLPLGPTWEAIHRVLTEISGDDPASLRARAIIMLLSVYGVRSGEVRRLCLDDIDWRNDQIHFVRSKSGRKETAPLAAGVGNAIARYLHDGRPKTNSETVFLTLRAPHRPLSTSGLHHVVARRFSRIGTPSRGRGPHGLRHACARHLVASGHSLEVVGDHLGHRSPDATRIYAKVDLTSLRRVAFEDLGGLS